MHCMEPEPLREELITCQLFGWRAAFAKWTAMPERVVAFLSTQQNMSGITESTNRAGFVTTAAEQDK
jgi:hypothetical protein